MRKQSQQGYMLLSMLFALAIGAAVLATLAKVADHKFRADRALIEGQSLGQWAIGLRGIAAAAQDDPAKLPGNPYTAVGVNWLKSPSCGGLPINPPEGYVPCSFTGQAFGPTYSTTITLTPATKEIEARTTFIVPAMSGDIKTRMLLAENTVQAALKQQSSNGLFFAAFANSQAGAIAAPSPSILPAAVDQGRVLVVVNNAPSNDIWLRTDGTNKMLADLNMGNHSLRNAKDGEFAGDVRVKGATQIDNGLTVTHGSADFREGVIAKDMVLDSIGKRASQAVYDSTVLTGASAYTVSKPDCSGTPNNAPSIYTSIQSTGSPVGSDALYSATVKATDNGSTWRVVPMLYGTSFELTGDDENIYLNKSSSADNPSDMTIVVMTQCR